MAFERNSSDVRTVPDGADGPSGFWLVSIRLPQGADGKTSARQRSQRSDRA
ncbi:hypothetical protein ZHAS_00006941 [Anopheles sinensis]|uniref:Uncharacterized protein n=1 Tax=Anopheles sinensis TaxID=74873 RepID=A0A084VNA5_ANOSI|nr:hypothetical protein ZHAS_00006941 [Anopheles sinensis]